MADQDTFHDTTSDMRDPLSVAAEPEPEPIIPIAYDTRPLTRPLRLNPADMNDPGSDTDNDSLAIELETDVESDDDELFPRKGDTEDSPLMVDSVNGSDYDTSKMPSDYISPLSPNWRPTLRLRMIQLVTCTNVFLMGWDSSCTASTYALIGSEFHAANNVSWISTSYLITSTAFQPLYGRFSDIVGRRICFLFAINIFFFGTLACSMANSLFTLNIARAVTGIGGGGLVTLGTIILSDMVPFRLRGIYQSAINFCWGFGSITGASTAGAIADAFGWRFVFIFQLPIFVVSIVLGYMYIIDPPFTGLSTQKTVQNIDFGGSVTLVLGLASLLAFLSMGGNEYAWTDNKVVGFGIAALVLLSAFIFIEGKVAKMPVMPLRILKGRLPVSSLCTTFFTGLANNSQLFMLPLYFQSVNLDTAAVAGARLIVPSLVGIIGSIATGIIMSRWGHLSKLMKIGTLIMLTGCILVTTFGPNTPTWKYVAFLMPTQFGNAILMPACLFSMLAHFSRVDHAVATGTCYLIRSIGLVLGVSVSNAINQNTLSTILPRFLADTPNGDEIADLVIHSVTAIKTLPLETREIVIMGYTTSLRRCFQASALSCCIALFASLFCTASTLHRKEDDEDEEGPTAATRNEEEFV
ncbi:major facilitator superfamily domain-containing protein [Lipomyces tetrasporus]|uniref:Major facilitator superfamily domain-containing protein n=1 Tax=Lipomyces tetrasporus TaxID=54092 RepID=A0AAD7QYR7_9ASCO|nr:major facilitator superfamily domain-containing protein [Lipomyces tetrasporus]KAJ8103934.1 major facilitator superfamily domain-containing protein [Lipomyces tetrasporus]